jgi:hypothetical protein
VAAKFKMRNAGVGELLRSPGVQAEMLRRANVIKGIAESISPVGDAARDPHPGQYKASWRTSSRARGGQRKNRATATVWNFAPHARFVEYGTERVHAHHVLLRAAQVGGR